MCVRRRSLHQQPISREPDLNDGMRLNARPFVTAGILRSRPTIHWQIDRCTNPHGSTRVNDLHLKRVEKIAARAAHRDDAGTPSS